MARKRCPVCHLFVGARPHSGALHDKIRTQRRLMKLGRGPFRRRRRKR